MATPKPRGWGKFDELARKLVGVPKESADKIMAQTPKRKRRKRRK
jgi:hypothetical protein